MTSSEDRSDNALHLVYEDPQLAARSEAAAALRRLGNAFVRHRLDQQLRRWSSLNLSLDHLIISNVVIRTHDRLTGRK